MTATGDRDRNADHGDDGRKHAGYAARRATSFGHAPTAAPLHHAKIAPIDTKAA